MHLTDATKEFYIYYTYQHLSKQNTYFCTNSTKVVQKVLLYDQNYFQIKLLFIFISIFIIISMIF